jgi:hypothetical protein
MEAMGGMNIADVFPSSKLLYMISRFRSRLERSHQDADEILENIIYEHRVCREVAKTDEESEAENLLDVLLNLQNHGDLGFPLTTDSIKATILVSIYASQLMFYQEC